MKRHFHEELESVRSNLMLMGERAVDSASLAMRALAEGDIDLAEKVIELDDVIDDIENQIDDEVSRYVGLRRSGSQRPAFAVCRGKGEQRS